MKLLDFAHKYSQNNYNYIVTTLYNYITTDMCAVHVYSLYISDNHLLGNGFYEKMHISTKYLK